MSKENFNLISLVNHSGCFDLQFRKDTRHERTGSPTYYRWKLQFVITAKKDHMAILERAQKELDCGTVGVIKEQARFSVQDIDTIVDVIIPHFTEHKLSENPPSHKASAGQSKKKDFELWQKAAAIIYKNKGKAIGKWEKNDLLQLIEIHSQMMKYKEKPRKQKWAEMAETIAKQPTKNEA